MNIKTEEIYSETYQILKLLGNEYIEKIPSKLFNIISEKRNCDYNPVYSVDIPLTEQKVKKETISMIALSHLNYWCENDEEKHELKKILKDNEDKHEKEIREMYNPNNIFRNRNSKPETKPNTIENETSIIEYKEPFFKKVIRKIINIFHKK